MKIKLTAVLVFLFIIQNNYGQYTDVINSNRPGESMSAFSVGKTVIQVESGLGYIKEKHDILEYDSKGVILDFNARYGFFREQLEAIVELSYQNDKYNSPELSEKRSGLRSTNIGFKYLVYDPFKNYEKKINIYSWKANHKFDWHQLIPAVSGYVGANLNFSDNQFIPASEDLSTISPKVMVITQHIFPGAYVFVTNIFVDKISTNNQSIGYIATFTKGFNEQWSGFLENKAIKGDYYADGIFSLGAAYLFSKNLQIDASISKNYKDTPSIFYGGFGISWRSDTNYKEVLIKSGKEEKNKSKKDKGKDKDKKKRLDEVELEKTNP
jgi:hypothetical protein